MRIPLPAAALRSWLALLAICTAGTVASAPLPPTWTRDFAAPIRWQRVTAFGQLLVSTTAALHAVDPDTGAVTWSHTDLARLPAEGLEELGGSPLVLISDGAAENPRTVVLNVFNGELVFDSRAVGLGQISAPRVLPQAGSLLVAGFEIGKPQPTLYAYSIDNGDLLWKSNVLDSAMNPSGNALLGLLMSAAIAMVKIDPVQSEPLELGDGTFLLGAMGHVMRLEAATGKVLWKTPFAGGTFEFRRTDARPGVVYVGAEEIEQVLGAEQATQPRAQTHYQAFAIADGAEVWKRAVRFQRPMNRSIIPLERGLVVSDGDSDKGKLLLLDYDTGESLWGNKGRGIEVAGQVLDHSFAGTDLVMTTGYDSVWKPNADTAYLLYVLDTTAGRFKFEKPFEVKGRMLGTELAPQGLIYVTTHEINIFDPATGALRAAPVLRSREPVVTVGAGRLVYGFNSDDGFLYRFDRDTGVVAKLSQMPFEFVDKDRARALDLVDDTLVLMGQQTVAGFGLDGALRFNAHYAAPRNPTWMRALAWAEGVRAGMASVSAGLYGAAFAEMAGDAAEGSAGRDVATQLSEGFVDLSSGYQNLAGDYVRFARQRYEASADSRDFLFMMVQHEDRRVVLAQVSKRDGRILAEIDLARDKEPVYQVDDISSFVYYNRTESVVAGYRFSPERVEVAFQ